jgi:hypothetical protein
MRFNRGRKPQRAAPAGKRRKELHVSPVDTRTFNTHIHLASRRGPLESMKGLYEPKLSYFLGALLDFLWR